MMSVCGVMCSECPAFVASGDTEAQKRVAEAWHRIYDLKFTADQIQCGGCLGPDDELFHTQRKCTARACCRSKGFNTCAECPVTICELLEKAQMVWDTVPDLAETLSEEDFDVYAKPYCGHRVRLAVARAAYHDRGV